MNQSCFNSAMIDLIDSLRIQTNKLKSCFVDYARLRRVLLIGLLRSIFEGNSVKSR